MRVRVIFFVAAVSLTLAGCSPSGSAPSMLTPGAPNGPAVLAPLVTDPPEGARAEHPSESTYSVYQGVVCGIVPRPEYGYTVRYPKIWEAREYGPTTWLVDFGNGGPVREQVTTTESPAPIPAENTTLLIGAIDVAPAIASATIPLEARLAEGWRSRGLLDLQMVAVPGARVGGQPGARWDVRYTASDGTPMAGYTSAAIVDGHLYRVEIAMPADRYAHLERASAIVADQLLIAGAETRAAHGESDG